MVVKPTQAQGGQGFKRITAESLTTNQFWATCGREYTGKSSFALSFPGPIDYMTTDPGCFRAVNSAVKRFQDKDIRMKTYNMPTPVLRDNKKRMIEKVDGTRVARRDAEVDYDAYVDKWNEWYADWMWATSEDSDSRTVVVDNGTDVRDLITGARHGKLIRITPTDRSSLNMELDATIKQGTRLNGCTKNVVWIDKMGKKYVTKKVRNSQGEMEDKDVWDGDYERKGYTNLGYIAEVTLEHFTQGGLFGARFGLKSGPNKALIGAEYVNDPKVLEVITAERQAKALEEGRDDWEEVGVQDVCTYEFLMEELYG
jgi:hypothetical protein